MSLEPAPGIKREPLAKSAPCLRASTNRGISAGSVEPSASSMTMKSPWATAKPQAKAFALAFAGLTHHQDVGTELLGHRHSVVARVPVHQDHLVALGVEGGEDVGQVQRLVLGRDDDADGRFGLERVLVLLFAFRDCYRATCGPPPKLRHPLRRFYSLKF